MYKLRLKTRDDQIARFLLNISIKGHCSATFNFSSFSPPEENPICFFHTPKRVITAFHLQVATTYWISRCCEVLLWHKINYTFSSLKRVSRKKKSFNVKSRRKFLFVNIVSSVSFFIDPFSQCSQSSSVASSSMLNHLLIPSTSNFLRTLMIFSCKSRLNGYKGLDKFMGGCAFDQTLIFSSISSFDAFLVFSFAKLNTHLDGLLTTLSITVGHFDLQFGQRWTSRFNDDGYIFEMNMTKI